VAVFAADFVAGFGRPAAVVFLVVAAREPGLVFFDPRDAGRVSESMMPPDA
jgi:hypothetical protein